MTSLAHHDPHYAVLGLAQPASLDEIRTAYKKLALKWHPDRHINDKEMAARMFVEISNAYTVLTKKASSASTPHAAPAASSSHEMPASAPTSHSQSPGRGQRHSHESTPRERKEGKEEVPRDRPRARYATVPDAKFPGKSPASQRESVYTNTSGNPLNTPFKDAASHHTSSPQKPGRANNLRPRPSHRNTDAGNYDSSHRHSHPLPSKSSCPSLSSSSSTHSEPTYNEERSPRKLRKSPPEHQRSRPSPAPAAKHDEDYVYLKHADAPDPPLDPPLQPLANALPTVNGAKAHDPATPTQWIFPLELSMHDLYHGTSQKFHISTADGKDHSVKVVIPPGTLPGAKVHALNTVMFEVRERAHDYLARVAAHPHDLYMCVELPWTPEEDMPEGHIAFSGPSGEDLQVALPRGLAEGTEGTRISGKGMPRRKADAVVGHGDLYIRWDFFSPETSHVRRSRWDMLKSIIHVSS